MTQQESVTQADRETLLPCPFCGGEAIIITYRNRRGVKCGDLLCGGMTRVALSDEDGVAMWNTRLATVTTTLGTDRDAIRGEADWQDIASAPRDGTPFLAGRVGADGDIGRVIVARAKEKWPGFYSTPGDYFASKHTHWMPLPAPPLSPLNKLGHS